MSRVLFDYIKHFFDPKVMDWDLSLKFSRKNCHLHGLHSIVIRQNDGNKIRQNEGNKGLLRFFVTDPDHEITQGKLGIHNHRYNVNLFGVYGTPANEKYEASLYNGFDYDKFIFYSQKKIERIKGKTFLLNRSSREILTTGKDIFMTANELHTISVPQGQEACWIVFEGEQVRDYTHLYNLGQFPVCSGHEPMNKQEIMNILDKNISIIEQLQKAKNNG